MRVLVVCVLVVWPTLAAAFSPLTEEQSGALQKGLIVTANGFVLPAYENHAAAAEELAQAISQYCDGEGNIDRAKAAFRETLLAWQRASVVQFGPVAEAEGPMRIQLWPDPKGFSKRAIRAALRQADPALLRTGGLEGRSIALTGLTALEALLYGDLPVESYACGLALAIAQFQADLADDLITEWTPGSAFRADYDGAADGNARYQNVDALVREFLAGMVAYVDKVRRFKLLRGLGNAPGEARPERTEAKLSDAGLQSINASFRALSDIYTLPEGLFVAASDVGGSSEYTAIALAASAISKKLDEKTQSLVEILSEDGLDAEELRRFAALLVYHETFLKTGFTGPLGLSAGFTAADGD